MAEEHANVGAHVLRRWRLPSMLDEPIVCHHDWTRATAAPRKAAVTYFVNRLSHRYGFGCDADPVDLLSVPSARSWASIGRGSTRPTSVRRDSWTSRRRFWGSLKCKLEVPSAK